MAIPKQCSKARRALLQRSGWGSLVWNRRTGCLTNSGAFLLRATVTYRRARRSLAPAHPRCYTGVASCSALCGSARRSEVEKHCIVVASCSALCGSARAIRRRRRPMPRCKRHSFALTPLTFLWHAHASRALAGNVVETLRRGASVAGTILRLPNRFSRPCKPILTSCAMFSNTAWKKPTAPARGRAPCLAGRCVLTCKKAFRC